MEIDGILRELEELDKQLVPALEARRDMKEMLADRARLIASACELLLANGATPHQIEELSRAEVAGATLLRRLLMRRHLLSGELANVSREQSLWDAIAASNEPAASHQVDCSG